MALQTVILGIIVILCLALAVYSEWLRPLRYPLTQWTIPLRRLSRKDWGIVTVLLLVVFIQQRLRAEGYLNSGLLLGLILLTLWYGWIRQPIARVSAEGIVINGQFIRWAHIKRYHLTAEGALILTLAQQKVTLCAQRADDLQRLYQHIIAQPNQ
ncbi:DUF986 family protein [Rosenbergiella epipactidis]|uniref:DUF986 family protein n=1 Tax=Rosenbergiella epipactidis TaxID=1544694 RepID=UPI001F4E482B|nr:DUF986 family protein [Rosenbergiella epipactidis]